jgi:hypothetical protein
MSTHNNNNTHRRAQLTLGLASEILVAPRPLEGKSCLYWLGPGDSALRSINTSVSVNGLAVENLPPDFCFLFMGF